MDDRRVIHHLPFNYKRKYTMIDRSELTQTFAKKYESLEQDWGGNSGPGSDPYYNIPYRSFLETFLKINDIRSVVDVGCGDWQFSRFLNYLNIEYLGLDLVRSVIERNDVQFGASNIRFQLAPQRIEDIPSGDLLIMKDVLQHLPSAEIMRYRDLLFPRFKFCLITNSYRKVNTPLNIDVPPGGFRCIDLTQPPFDVHGANVLQFTTEVYEELRTLLIVNS